MGDVRYKSGTSLNKTEKEVLRDEILDLLGWDLSDEAMVNLGYLNMKTLKEIQIHATKTMDVLTSPGSP